MNHVLLTGLGLVVAATALAAPIEVPGSLTYTQNFDVLASATDGSTSTSTWTDDVTIPGWFLWKAGTTNAGAVGTNYTYRVSSGIAGLGNAGGLADTGHFYSIGAVGSTDRALGSVPITGAGEHSCLALFRNTSAFAVKLTRVAYNVEIRRTNQTANNVETIALWWKKDVDQAALLTMTTGTATVADWPAEKSTAPSGLYITGWNRIAEADHTYSSPLANTQIDVLDPVAVTPTDVTVEPGELIALRWGNINDGGADAVAGIDDLTVEFTSTSGLAGTAQSIVRNAAGTPRVPTDDTVSFSLNITGPGTGWRITAPASLAGTTGTYGVTKAIPAQPIASFSGANHTLRVEFADQTTPSKTGAVVVTAPWCQLTPLAATNFTYLDKGTADPADDEVRYSLRADGVWTGAQFLSGTGSANYGTGLQVTHAAPGTFTTHTLTDSADANCTSTITVFPPARIGTVELTPTVGNLLSEPVAQDGAVQWVVDAAARTITQTALTVQTPYTLTSQPVNLATTGDAELTATIFAISGTSTSGFEAADFLSLDVIVDGVTESALVGYDLDGDGKLTGGVELPINVANVGYIFEIKHLIPPSASSVQVVLTASSNSTSETFVVQDLRVGIPPPEVFATEATNIIRQDNGPGLADDTVTFDTDISGRFGGNGWTTSGATPTSGFFGTTSFTVPAGGVSVTLRLADNTQPAYFTDLIVPLPGPYFLGSSSLRGTTGHVWTESPVAPASWKLDTTVPSLTMNNGVEDTVTSEVVDLAGVAGDVQFTANLHVKDLTGGFEATDTFEARLILDGDFNNPIILTQPYDLDGSGRMNGAELCPAPAVNPTVQEFDYPLAATIPDSVTSAQLVISGVNNSNNEIMVVSGILFSQTAVDSDGDGMPDAWELANGLNPNSAADRDLDKDGDGLSNYLEYTAGTDPRSTASVLKLTAVQVTSATTGAGTVTWQSVSGKRYQLQTSPNLTTPFADAGSPVTASGATTSAPVTLGAGRGFVRVRVLP